MSNEANFNALPDRAIERLFARFAAMFGDSAMRRMWGQQSPDAVKAIWADSLGRFDVQQLMAGLRNLEDAGNVFPPTLPEFMAACRKKPDAMPAEHRPLLAPPPRTADELAAGKALADRIMREVSAGRVQRDPAEWARQVIKRYAAGDRSVAHCSAKIAGEALRNLGREAA